MKYNRIVIGLLSLAAVSCSIDEIANPEKEGLTIRTPDVVYASIEDLSNDVDTKVFADDQLRVLWNEDDRITLFNKYTYGYEYYFKGDDGDSGGAFGKVPNADVVSGNTLASVFAVYPHQEKTKINNDGIITFTLPAEQTYAPNSFGRGANTMVSKTDDVQLKFKNVGGYLSFRLYGEGISVSSITLKGNNGEFLAGRCTIDMSGGLPETVMDSGKATEKITLVCNPPVELGTSDTDYIEFWMVVPPTTFSEGVTFTVKTSDGGVFEKSSTASFTLGRNKKMQVPVMEVIPNYDNAFVPFEDANFKA